MGPTIDDTKPDPEARSDIPRCLRDQAVREKLGDQSERASLFGDLPAGFRERTDELVTGTADSLFLEFTKTSDLHVRREDNPEALGQQTDLDVEILELKHQGGVLGAGLAMIGTSELEANLFKGLLVRAQAPSITTQLGPEDVQETLPRLGAVLATIVSRLRAITDGTKPEVLVVRTDVLNLFLPENGFRRLSTLADEREAIIGRVDNLSCRNY